MYVVKCLSERNIQPELSQADVTGILYTCLSPIFHGLMSGNCGVSDYFFQMMAKHKETTEAVLDNWSRFKGGGNHL